MKILVVTQYFWPESFIINDLVKTLVAQGHDVQVVTGKPNYPEGKVFDGYTADGLMEEQVGNVRVFRAPLRPRRQGGAVNLALNYLSFVWNGLRFFRRATKRQSYDAIFVFAISPLTAAIPAIYLKWKLKSHLAIWVQDLWPESLSATGFVRNRWILRAVGVMVRAIYAGADTIMISSQQFWRPIERYAKASKIVYYANPAVDNPIAPQDTEIPTNLLQLLEQNFCVLFAGNLGTAQSVETIVAAAERLRHRPEIKLVLVGSGSMSAWLEQQKQERQLDNVILAGRFPAAAMPAFFQRAQGLLVTLKREEIFAYTVPCKIQSYLAASRPVIAAVDGAGAQVVEEARAGLTCPAEDDVQLAQRIEQLFQMSQTERDRMGQAGRAYFLENFEMERHAARLVQIFEDRIHPMKNPIAPPAQLSRLLD